jgi:hypothetical protein
MKVRSKRNMETLFNCAFLKFNLKQVMFGVTIGIILCLIYNAAFYLSLKQVTTTIWQSEQHYIKYANIKEAKNVTDYPILTVSTNDLAIDSLFGKSAANNKCNYGEEGPRILCVVFTYKKNFLTKAIAVNQTWGKRCTKLLFMAGIKHENETDPHDLNIVHLKINETYQNLTDKTIATLIYSYENYIDEFDWLLKADDVCVCLFFFWIFLFLV